MAPKIGVSSKVMHFSKWGHELKELPYSVLEINRRSSMTHIDGEWVMMLKDALQRFDLSMHSSCRRIFSENEQFTLTEINVVKSEILMCEMWGAKELIIHLRNQKLDEVECRKLKGLLSYAKKHNVQLVYESNQPLDAEVALDTLTKFPELEYNLDLGHLNRGIHHKGVKVDRFIKAVAQRTTYMHVHNNYGDTDSHSTLDQGDLDWKHVLDMLDMNRIRKIIIEMKDKDAVIKTMNEIEEYLKTR
jgi:sugar phosphate isomerase/epimerase